MAKTSRARRRPQERARRAEGPGRARSRHASSSARPLPRLFLPAASSHLSPLPPPRSLRPPGVLAAAEWTGPTRPQSAGAGWDAGSWQSCCGPSRGDVRRWGGGGLLGAGGLTGGPERRAGRGCWRPGWAGGGLRRGSNRGWDAKGPPEEGTGWVPDCRSLPGSCRPPGWPLFAARAGGVGAPHLRWWLGRSPPAVPSWHCCRLRRCRVVAAAGLAVPAAPCVVRVFSCPHSGFCWWPCLVLALCPSPPGTLLRSCCRCLWFTVWDGLRPGQISTCKERPASKLTAWPWQTTRVQAVGAQCPNNWVKLSETGLVLCTGRQRCRAGQQCVSMWKGAAGQREVAGC